eukprot:gene32751-40423_t
MYAGAFGKRTPVRHNRTGIVKVRTDVRGNKRREVEFQAQLDALNVARDLAVVANAQVEIAAPHTSGNEHHKQAGEYGRAMELVSNNQQLLLPSQEVFDKLEAKHPAKNSERGVTDARIEKIMNFTVDIQDEVIVDGSTVQGIVNESRKFVKHGLDKLRNEHLQALCGRDAQPEGETLDFCNLMSELVTVVANGKQPADVSAALRDSEMFGGAKGSPEKDKFAIDAKNAFNSANKLIGVDLSNYRL